MKRFTLISLGTLLLIPLYLADAFGISIDSFRDEIIRPENLPGGRTTAAGAETKINEAVQFAINLVLYASGAVAVFMLVFAGIRYVMSMGNQERMDSAKKTIQYALIGLIAVILAFAAVQNIISLIFQATT